MLIILCHNSVHEYQEVVQVNRHSNGAHDFNRNPMPGIMCVRRAQFRGFETDDTSLGSCLCWIILSECCQHRLLSFIQGPSINDVTPEGEGGGGSGSA